MTHRNRFISQRYMTSPLTLISLGLVAFTSSLAQAQTETADDTVPTFPEQSNQPERPRAPTPAADAASPSPAMAPGSEAPTPANSSAKPPQVGVASTSGSTSAPNVVAPPSAPPQCPPALPNGPSRSGFYFRIGTGLSVLSFRGDGPNGTAKSTALGSEMTLALGGNIARGVVLAGAVHGVQSMGRFRGGPFENSSVVTVNDGSTSEPVDANDRANFGLSTIGVLLDVYPSLDMGWHGGGSVGIAMNNLQNLADNSVYFSTGVGGMLFLGYDWHLAKDWGFGLSLVGTLTSKGSYKDQDDQRSTHYEMAGYSLGVESSLVYF